MNGLREAEAWSLVLGQVGKGLVFAALALFLLSLIGSFRKIDRLQNWGFWLGSAMLAGTMGVLMTLFICDQFQYGYVFARSDAEHEVIYKIAGVWAGQQGSFLLWGLCSAAFGLFALPRAGHYRRVATGVFTFFLAALAGILAYETPFNVMPEIVMDGKTFVPPIGNGLTPALHNYWVIIHPPTIFVGFGALTLLFAYGVAAMVTGDLEDYVGRVRPWALATLGILGLGICMGGFWAYETLGWGGFWAWDPVENVSLVPWIVLACFVHGMIVQTARHRWYSGNVLLAGIPFLAFVYGTFLTRSGFLADVSVHSFAEMDQSARWILLGFLGVCTLGYVGLWATRGRALARKLEAPAPEEKGPHREGAYRYGVLMLSLLAVGISMGMSWPLVGALSGQQVAVVSEGLYHDVVVWVFIPLMILMAVGPFLSWRGEKQLFQKIVNVLAGSIFLTGLAVFGFRNPTWGVQSLPDQTIEFPIVGNVPLLPWMAVLTFVCMFTFIANLVRAIEIGRRSKLGVGGFVSHLGFAILIGGLILSRGFEKKERVYVRENQPATALNYTLTYKGPTDPTMRDRDGKLLFDVKRVDGTPLYTAEPGLYYHLTAEGKDEPMVWPHIHREPTHDVYISLLPPVIFVWEEPETFKPGETKTVRDVTVTYLEPTMAGSPGSTGARFGAKLRITVDGQTYNVNPYMELTGEGGPRPNIELVGPELAATLMGMNAEDRTVQVQMLFSSPIYPIDLFYKPLTILVWIGTGILTLGGLWSAAGRRYRPRPKKTDSAPVAADAPDSPEPEDATLATAQS